MKEERLKYIKNLFSSIILWILLITMSSIVLLGSQIRSHKGRRGETNNSFHCSTKDEHKHKSIIEQVIEERQDFFFTWMRWSLLTMMSSIGLARFSSSKLLKFVIILKSAAGSRVC